MKRFAGGAEILSFSRRIEGANLLYLPTSFPSRLRYSSALLGKRIRVYLSGEEKSFRKRTAVETRPARNCGTDDRVVNTMSYFSIKLR
ncbi:hypothetical protein X777_06879 [Ooceraea biroi]|uniref:Uncharacterized protein n=1 Tax=Ooceraea biroi TaxID=2015173 RepID=A0A026WC36_OOCBI|nr:hypothetical protein X777_06879 [Ooceraea biroi]